jgi:hypothetical protein
MRKHSSTNHKEGEIINLNLGFVIGGCGRGTSNIALAPDTQIVGRDLEA